MLGLRPPLATRYWDLRHKTQSKWPDSGKTEENKVTSLQPVLGDWGTKNQGWEEGMSNLLVLSFQIKLALLGGIWSYGKLRARQTIDLSSSSPQFVTPRKARYKIPKLNTTPPPKNQNRSFERLSCRKKRGSRGGQDENSSETSDVYGRLVIPGEHPARGRPARHVSPLA